MIENNGKYTISEAMNTIPERDLVFIAAYNPMAFKSMCIMWTLELELIETGKLPLHNPVVLKTRKSKNWFVCLWKWLFPKSCKN
jgi:hypothetical protein